MIFDRFTRPDYAARRYCSLGTAILTATGVAETIGETASAFLGPAITAGIGAAGSAAAGGDPLTGALIGGGIGAVGQIPGLGFGDASTLAENVGNLVGGGGGALSAGATDLGGTSFPQSVGDPVGLATVNPETGLPVPGTYDMQGNLAGPEGLTGKTPAGGGHGWTYDDATGQMVPTQSAATNAGPLGNVERAIGSGSGGSGGAPGKGGLFGGVNGSALGLGALMAVAQMFNKPQQYPIGNVSSQLAGSTDATKGPLWNASLPRYDQSQQRNASAPAGFDPYKAGFQPMPDFFNGNYVRFPQQAAEGGGIGALNSHAQGGEEFSTRNGQHYVEGPGDGQSDNVPAQLSDGEYVLTAHDVAVLGGGSNRAGAAKLDQWREHLHRTVGGDKFIPKKAAGALSQLAPAGAR